MSNMAVCEDAQEGSTEEINIKYMRVNPLFVGPRHKMKNYFNHAEYNPVHKEGRREGRGREKANKCN